jgi:DNA-binding NtrC family response regulator
VARTDNCSTEILVFEDRDGSLRALADGLRLEGHRVDEVANLVELRARYLEAGGHALLLLAPGLPDAIGARAAKDLLDLDPQLRVATFGENGRGPAWPEAGLVRLQAHHPASRAALGAVLRIVATRRAG